MGWRILVFYLTLMKQPYLRVSIYNIGVFMVNIELMWGGLEMGGKTSFSESFHPFRAEPHKFYIKVQMYKQLIS
jgi:hypothetical protein